MSTSASSRQCLSEVLSARSKRRIRQSQRAWIRWISSAISLVDAEALRAKTSMAAAPSRAA